MQIFWYLVGLGHRQVLYWLQSYMWMTSNTDSPTSNTDSPIGWNYPRCITRFGKYRDRGCWRCACDQRWPLIGILAAWLVILQYYYDKFSVRLISDYANYWTYGISFKLYLYAIRTTLNRHPNWFISLFSWLSPLFQTKPKFIFDRPRRDTLQSRSSCSARWFKVDLLHTGHWVMPDFVAKSLNTMGQESRGSTVNNTHV